MDDDNSMTIDQDESELTKDKPIMSIFKRLIGNDNKQNTVLTNAQIMDILQREFNVETHAIHSLELDIYLSVMKKFLKDWPQWDHFDQVVNNLRSKGNNDSFNKILSENYKSLKDYLKMMLDIAKSLAKDTVKNVEDNANKRNQNPKDNKDSKDIILEVHCTRGQLNQLFFRYPHPKLNGTVFNVGDEVGPSRISLNMPSFEAIINWFDFTVNINIGTISYKRQTIHDLSHKLVNKKLNIKNEVVSELNTCWEEKASTKTKTFSKRMVLETIDKIADCSSNIGDDNYKFVTKFLMYIMKKDIINAPDVITVPATYRRHMNKYPYVRNLYTDVDIDKNSEAAKKYLLQLEETISPKFQFCISKFDTKVPANPVKTEDYLNHSRIFTECRMCTVVFGGMDLLKDMQQHFLECHINEKDWTCKKCQNVFSMGALAGSRWFHKC